MKERQHQRQKKIGKKRTTKVTINDDNKTQQHQVRTTKLTTFKGIMMMPFAKYLNMNVLKLNNIKFLLVYLFGGLKYNVEIIAEFGILFFEEYYFKYC